MQIQNRIPEQVQKISNHPILRPHISHMFGSSCINNRSLVHSSSSLRLLGRVPISCGLLLAALFLLGAVLESLLPLLLEVLPPLGLLLSLLRLLLLS